MLPISPCFGAGTWGGSLDLTSDYLVRGVSRTNDQAALQLDLHYLDSSGFAAGFFASNTQIAPGEPRDAELSAFLGYVWSLGDDWQGKILISTYDYPWNFLGSRYNYEELEAGATYRGWLNATVTYSPNAPGYAATRGLVSGGAESAELNAQWPLWKKLSATGGVGYYYSDGQSATGYAYWSVGAVYDWAPLSLTVSYVDASEAANSLYYNAAYGGRWVGTLFWRF